MIRNISEWNEDLFASIRTYCQKIQWSLVCKIFGNINVPVFMLLSDSQVPPETWGRGKKRHRDMTRIYHHIMLENTNTSKVFCSKNSLQSYNIN